MSNYQRVADDVVDMDENDDIIIQPDLQTTNRPSIGFSQISNEQQQQALPPLPVLSSSSITNNINKSKKTYEGGPFSLNYYRQYFDIDTLEFFGNCYQSLNPLSELPVDSFETPGDLYGPVWITATLVFLLFFCNSLAELISSILNNNENSSPKTNYFKILVTSINLLYGYTIMVPLIFYLSLWFYFKVPLLISLTRLISIYSYANLLWAPAALLSIFRGVLVNHNLLSSILKWVCIGVGALLSGTSIIIKLKQYLDQSLQDDKRGYIILGLLILAHMGYAIGVKVSFFGDL